MKNVSPAWLTVLSISAVVLIGYWATGPQELAPWQGFGDMAGNLGARAQKQALAKAKPEERMALQRQWSQPQWHFLEKFSVPEVAKTFFLLSLSEKEIDAEVRQYRTPMEGARRAPPAESEVVFTRFMAFDSLTAAALAGALLLWRRQNDAARQLALSLSLFAVAIGFFLVNGQARLRGALFTWPSLSRALSDVAATLAFGLSLLGFDKFLSTFPVRLEDWQVVQSQLRWRGKSLVTGLAARPWYRGGSGNLVSLARKVMKVIFCVLLMGTVLTSMPALLHPTSFVMETGPDGTPKGFREGLYMFSSATGTAMGLLAIVLIGTFGWLIASSLLAKLRAAREHSTEEERRQADWLFAGGLVAALMLAVFSLGLVFSLVYLAWGDGSLAREIGGAAMMMFFPAGWMVMLLALAGAVFLSKSFGPKPLLKRTLLITGIGVSMSFLLATIEHVLANGILGHSSAAFQHSFSTVLAGGLVLFPMGLFRHRIEHGVDRLLNRYMPATAIAEGKRQEMAIVFSDLGGYSALSASDEQQALHLAGHLQKEAAEVGRRQGGRIVKTIGDAVLWVFPRPEQAFAASLALAEAIRREARKDGLPDLPLNSGVHFGSLVEAPDGDVFGAAVNLAARIQGAAQGGVVVASADAVLEVAGGFRFEPMGRLELKNIPTPIPCFRVMPA